VIWLLDTNALVYILNGDSIRENGAYSGHRERPVRSIVNGSGRSEATLVFVG
jgi:hypothetical protein